MFAAASRSWKDILLELATLLLSLAFSNHLCGVDLLEAEHHIKWICRNSPLTGQERQRCWPESHSRGGGKGEETRCSGLGTRSSKPTKKMEIIFFVIARSNAICDLTAS